MALAEGSGVAGAPPVTPYTAPLQAHYTSPSQTVAGPGTQNIIPDAGVYGQETAAAVNAYNNAVAQATAQRNALYNQYGLNNSGQVDPNNPQGAYQQMLRSQADQFTADEQDAAGRNLGKGGLANQQLSHDRNDANAQDFQFQNQVGQVATDYQNALTDALGTKQSAISQAYSDAMSTALQNMLANLQAGYFDAPGSGNTSQGSSGTSSKKSSASGAGGGGRSTPHHSGAPISHAARSRARRLKRSGLHHLAR